MAQTMAVNAIAPFVICSLLKVSMMPPSPLTNDKNDKVNSDNDTNKKKDENINTNANRNENENENRADNTNKNYENNDNNNNNNNNENNKNNSRTLDLCYSHIVNVTALEGKFNVGKKSGGHPHTVTWTKKCSIYSVFLLLFFDALF